MSKLAETVSRNIKARRAARGVTQEELCRLTGLSLRYLSLLENSPQNLTLEKLEVLAEALAVSPSDLVTKDAGQPTRLANPEARSVSIELAEEAFELLRQALGR